MTMSSTDGDENEERWHTFNPETLMYAMAPIKHVMAPFLLAEKGMTGSSNDESSIEQETIMNAVAIERQDSFAIMISDAWKDQYSPLKAYLCHLVKSYCQGIGDDQIQSETLMELMLQVLSYSPSPTSNIPLETEACYQSFWIPPLSKDPALSSQSQELPLRLRVYPKHNNVALRLWEGGAALAEFWMAETSARFRQDPEACALSSWLPSDPLTIVELGAGIGATALALLGVNCDEQSSCCSIHHVYATDYTRACMENLEHNIQLNQVWISQQRQQQPRPSLHPKEEGTEQSIISAVELDWTWFDLAPKDVPDQPMHQEQSADLIRVKQVQDMLADSNVLLAADVAYDPSVLSSLARTIHFFLSTPSATTRTTASSPPKQKMALLATTRRNLNTFQKLHTELEDCGVEIHSLGRRYTKDSPILFPAKFHQPRSDVWYTVLTLPSR